MAPAARIFLELDAGERISGLARTDGEEREFSGLLELYAAIERLRLLANEERERLPTPGNSRE